MAKMPKSSKSALDERLQDREMDYVTVGQAARLLKCSLYHVNLLAQKKQLTRQRLQTNGWYRIQRQSIEEYAERVGMVIDLGILQEPRRKPARKSRYDMMPEPERERGPAPKNLYEMAGERERELA